MVVSEVYYPKGWRAFLETGEQLMIYKTNHILRSVIVPYGQHTITMEFKPTTYYTGIRISLIGWIITYIGLLIMLYRNYREQIVAWLKSRKSTS
jgi:uncharacterized membrane protein YfhO